jgi:hypothetical protein
VVLQSECVHHIFTYWKLNPQSHRLVVFGGDESDDRGGREDVCAGCINGFVRRGRETRASHLLCMSHEGPHQLVSRFQWHGLGLPSLPNQELNKPLSL